MTWCICQKALQRLWFKWAVILYLKHLLKSKAIFLTLSCVPVSNCLLCPSLVTVAFDYYFFLLILKMLSRGKWKPRHFSFMVLKTVPSAGGLMSWGKLTSPCFPPPSQRSKTKNKIYFSSMIPYLGENTLAQMNFQKLNTCESTFQLSDSLLVLMNAEKLYPDRQCLTACCYFKIIALSYLLQLPSGCLWKFTDCNCLGHILAFSLQRG